MIMACYHFQVLNNAFTVHWNFKAPKSPTLKARRTQQTMDNEAKFETFFRETREKYKDNKCVYLPTP